MVDLFMDWKGSFIIKNLKVSFTNLKEREKLRNLALLDSIGYFTYNSFNIKKFYKVLTLCLCVLYGSQNKQRYSPHAKLRD